MCTTRSQKEQSHSCVGILSFCNMHFLSLQAEAGWNVASFTFLQPCMLNLRCYFFLHCTQEDGTILGCCATGTSTKDSLLSWVRFLQRQNPDLQVTTLGYLISFFALASEFYTLPLVPIRVHPSVVYLQKL